MSELTRHFAQSILSSNIPAPRALPFAARAAFAAPRRLSFVLCAVAAVGLTLTVGFRHADAGVFVGIDNGDFEETTTLNDWAFTNVTGINNEPTEAPAGGAESGAGYAVFTGASGYLDANSADGAGPLPLGTYTIDFWLKIPNTGGATAGNFDVGFVAAIGDTPDPYAGIDIDITPVPPLFATGVPAVNGYNQYQFTADATATDGILAFATDGSVNGDVYFDNVTATAASAAVPEPASSILWAAGLLGLTRIRRRALRKAG